jgi:hypothetical protein
VLGADDPATVLQVLQSYDQELVDRIRQAHIEIVEAARIERGSSNMTADLPTNQDIANARFPQSYLKARAALRICARNFTPERYAKAVVSPW